MVFRYLCFDGVPRKTMRFCLLMILLRCGTIQLSKPNSSYAIQPNSPTKQNIFITIFNFNQSGAVANIGVGQISEKFDVAHCHPRQMLMDDTQVLGAPYQRLKRIRNKAQFFETIISLSENEPDRTFHLIFWIHDRFNFPVPYFDYLIHALTLGLVPFYARDNINLEYLAIKNGQQIQKNQSAFLLSTITWSPFALTGNTDTKEEVFKTEWNQSCAKFTENLNESGAKRIHSH